MSATKQFEVVAEYLRHVTTLSAGSIVILATFLEKIATKVEGKTSLVVALVGFAFTVSVATLTYTLTIYFESPEMKGPRPKWVKGLGGLGLLLTWLGFLISIGALVVFAASNVIR